MEGVSLKAREEMLAYLIVRLPATYAALASVLSQISPSDTLLDLGAGPGTSYWVTRSLWQTPCQITAVEGNAILLNSVKC